MLSAWTRKKKDELLVFSCTVQYVSSLPRYHLDVTSVWQTLQKTLFFILQNKLSSQAKICKVGSVKIETCPTLGKYPNNKSAWFLAADIASDDVGGR